jgi:hypothetical protein
LFTDQQRQAIFELRGAGLTGPQIAARCQSGTHGLEPFTIGADSARRIATEERRRRELEHVPPVATRAERDPRGATRELVRRLVTLCDRELGRLERRTSTPKGGPGSELDAVARVVERVERITRTLEPNPGAGAAAGSDATGPAPGLLERLASSR